jgi:hypothetical protein
MKKTLLSILLIALLFASTIFFLVNDVKADALFTDGFESGNLGNWNTNSTGGSVVTSPVHSGNYSADFTLSRHDCYAIRDLTTPMSTLNFTNYVYFSGLCSDYICVIMAEDANGNIIHYRVQDDNGSYQWRFNVADSEVINSSNPAPQAGQWYKIQLLATTGYNGTFYFLVDNQLRATITNQAFGAITQLRIGHDWDEGYVGGDSYFDDVVATQIASPVIIASVGDGGSINPNGEVSVSDGGSQSFTITPNTGYHITDVVVDGTSVGSVTSYSFNNVQAMSIHTITATFAINTFTIAASADVNGIISPSGNVGFNYGADKTFIITANSGYHISNVIVNGSSVGAVTSYTFTNITANYVISASFAADPTPTPTPSPSSTPSPTPSPSASTSTSSSSSNVKQNVFSGFASNPSSSTAPTATPSGSSPAAPSVTQEPTTSNNSPSLLNALAVIIIAIIAGAIVEIAYYRYKHKR